MTETVAFLVILMVPTLQWIDKSKIIKGLFILTMFISISVQAVGVFFYPAGEWEATPVTLDKAPERLWDWKDSQIARSLKYGPNQTPLTVGKSLIEGGIPGGFFLLIERVKEDASKGKLKY